MDLIMRKSLDYRRHMDNILFYSNIKMEYQNTIDHVFGEHIDLFEKSLTTLELDAFTGAITNYTDTDGSQDMNRVLRAPVKSMFSSTDPLVRKNIKIITNGFKKMKPFVCNQHLILYRKIRDKYFEKLSSGNRTIIDKGFTSTSISAEFPMVYEHPESYTLKNKDESFGQLLRLHLLPNIEYKLLPINKYSLVEEEEEILFAPGIKYYLCDDKNAHLLELKYIVRDCIIVPDEPRYTQLFDNRDWVKHWSNMIYTENRILFGNKSVNGYNFIYTSLILKFLNEIEYILHKNISEITHFDNNTLAFPGLVKQIDTLLFMMQSEEGDNEKPMRELVDSYIQRIKESADLKSIVFLTYKELNYALKHRGGGGRGGALITDVVNDVDILLQRMSPSLSQLPLSGGVKMQNTIENVFGEHRRAFEINLTGDDTYGMQLQLFKQSIRAYTDTKFTRMNQRLRSKTGFILNTLKDTKSISHTIAINDKVENYNKTLLEAFYKMDPFVSKEHLVLYRQINATNAKKLINKGSLIDNGFTSATIDPLVAIKHTHAVEIINEQPSGRTFRLHLLPNIEYKCIAIDTYSSVSYEKEILFAPNLKYYIVKQKDSEHNLNLDSGVVYDCIVVPDEPRYTNLFDKQGWLGQWSKIILEENRMLFDKEPIKTGYKDEDDSRYNKLSTIIEFINEIEYIIHKHIGNIQHYDHTPVFTNFIEEMETVINNLNQTAIHVLDIYIERLKKIDVYQGFTFKMYGDWAAATTASLHKRGGAAEVIQDLEALLQDLSQMTPISGGVRKELRKTRQLLGKAK